MTKAIVYIWPFMTKPAQQEEEVKIVEAGYTNKERLPITGRTIGGTPLKVWKVT